ncbi:NUDIX domain-containing protein [Rhodococcus sp. CX]|uniref:NUDIX hydrolase n=1 Tax=Rhodococcus sp. CX TaxID=2789880 RepID=UPI0018CEA561|nr:NUDIX domain-containing protein [Rhodococcus sp. CX]MBH0118285.1 NUDIX domain-containing protein [Rhodococcus sp. CX]
MPAASDRPLIRTAALALVRDRRLLQTRSAGATVFYMAGGKLEPGENAEQALHREIREELGVGLRDVTEVGVFETVAYGHPAGTRLHMTCFRADPIGDLPGRIRIADRIGDPYPAGEIAELGWFTVAEYAAQPEVAPGSMLVFEHLHSLGLVD